MSPPRTIPLSSAITTGESGTPATTAALIEELRAIDWFQFEKLVALVYRKVGYAVTRRGGLIQTACPMGSEQSIFTAWTECF